MKWTEIELCNQLTVVTIDSRKAVSYSNRDSMPLTTTVSYRCDSLPTCLEENVVLLEAGDLSCSTFVQSEWLRKNNTTRWRINGWLSFINLLTKRRTLKDLLVFSFNRGPTLHSRPELLVTPLPAEPLFQIRSFLERECPLTFAQVNSAFRVESASNQGTYQWQLSLKSMSCLRLIVVCSKNSEATWRPAELSISPAG
jgi:hypothetical protein